MDNFTIIGAGGIGCTLAATLAHAGVDVQLVERNPRKIETAQESGIVVGGRAFLVPMIAFDDWQPQPSATILLATKCYDNAAVLDRLPTSCELIPVQNGFDAQMQNYTHHFEGVASFVAECEPDRPVTRITRPGELHFGVRASQMRASGPRALTNALVQSPFFRFKVVPSILPYKYTKLMYNAAISPIAAAAGIDNGELLSHPTTRELFFGLLQENYSILRASKCELGRIGPLRPSVVAWILRTPMVARSLSRFFEPSLRGTYCSMAGEIQHGRTELANYNGHLLTLADQAGHPAPLNRAVVELVTRMTQSRTMPSRDRLASLLEVLHSSDSKHGRASAETTPR